MPSRKLFNFKNYFLEKVCSSFTFHFINIYWNFFKYIYKIFLKNFIYNIDLLHLSVCLKLTNFNCSHYLLPCADIHLKDQFYYWLFHQIILQISSQWVIITLECGLKVILKFPQILIEPYAFKIVTNSILAHLLVL